MAERKSKKGADDIIMRRNVISQVYMVLVGGNS
jgi:hypothetical protein